MTPTERHRLWRQRHPERWKALKRKARREWRRREAAKYGWSAVNLGRKL